MARVRRVRARTLSHLLQQVMLAAEAEGGELERLVGLASPSPSSLEGVDPRPVRRGVASAASLMALH